MKCCDMIVLVILSNNVSKFYNVYLINSLAYRLFRDA